MSAAPSTDAKPPMANGALLTGSPARSATTQNPTPSPLLTSLPPPAHDVRPSAFTSFVRSLVTQLQQPSYPLPVDPAAIVQQQLLSRASHFAHLLPEQLPLAIASSLSTRLPGHHLSAVSSHVHYHTDRMLCSLLSSHGFPSSPSIPHIVDDDDEDEGGAHSIRGISSGSLHLFPDLYTARLHCLRTAVNKAAVAGGGKAGAGPILLLPSIPNGHAWLDRLMFDLSLPATAVHFIAISPYLHIEEGEVAADKAGKQDIDGYQHVNPLLTHHIDINDLRITVASLSASQSRLILLTQLGSEWGSDELYYSERLKEVGEVCKELGVWLHVEGDKLWQEDDLTDKKRAAAAAEKVRDEASAKNGTSNKRGSRTLITSTLYQAADSIAFTTSSFSHGKLAVSALKQRAPSVATPTSAGGQQGKAGGQAAATPDFAVSFDNFVQLFIVWQSLSAVPSLPSHLATVNAAVNHHLLAFKRALIQTLNSQPFAVYLISPVGELVDDLTGIDGSRATSTHAHLFFQLSVSPPHEPSYFNLTVNDVNTFLAYRLALRARADDSSLGELYGSAVSAANYFDLRGFVFQPPYSSLSSPPTSSAYNALFAAIAHELSILDAAARARDELHHLLMQEHEFVYIPPSDLQNNPRVGVGAFRFIPSQVPAGHVDSLHHSLNKHLRRLPQWQWHGWPKSAVPSVAGEPLVSVFRSAVTVRGETCTVVDLCPALLERGASGLVSDVKSTAAHLSLPKRVMLDVSESVQRGIKEAERKLDEVTAQQYAPTSLVRWLPVVGSMINWAMPVQGEQHSAPGQSFDLRKKELNVVRYEYGANKAAGATPTLPAAAAIDRPTSALSLTPKGGDATAQLTHAQPLSNTISAAPVLQSHHAPPVTPSSKAAASTSTPPSSSTANSSFSTPNERALARSVSTPHTSGTPSSAVTPRHKRTISINIDEGEKAILQQPLRPLPDVLAFLTQGVVFTSYFPAPDTPPVNSEQLSLPNLSADLLIFYAPTFRASDGQPSQDATDLGTGPVLAWCEPNTRYMSVDQCIAVEHIHELYLGRKVGWPGGAGGGELCLSIMTPQVSLWLEAESRGMRDEFFLALYALLQSLHPVRSRKRPVGPLPATNGERAPAGAADGSGAVKKSERSGTATPPAATATTVVTTTPSSDAVVDPAELAAARQLLVHGMPFVVYVLDKHDTDVTSRHEVTLWFRPDTGTPSSSPMPSPSSASSAPTDSLVGHLCWCRRGPQLDYAPSRSLPITSTVQICLGKQTKALRNAAAADSPSDRCFSILCGRMILNLEATSVDDRQLWLQAFHKLMTAAGKQRVFETELGAAGQAGGKRLVDG